MNKKVEVFHKQIKKYHLEEEIKNHPSWLYLIDTVGIVRFNSLKIEAQDISFPKTLLLNHNLLDCNDYLKRIEAMTKIQN